MIAALREKNIPIISEIEFAGRYTRARMIWHYREQWENDDYTVDLSYSEKCRIESGTCR